MKFRSTAVLILATVFLIEVLLHVLSSTIPRIGYLLSAPWTWGQPLPDPIFIRRGNPLHPEHDARGFRNQRALEQADVVTMGDSQTYGTSVDASSSWPSVLSIQTDRSVYNMAFPGYSPAQSYLQLESALALKPQYVIVAVYFGNDFYDCHSLASQNATVQAHAPRLLFDEAQKLEQAQSLKDELEGLTPEPDLEEVSWYRKFLSQYSKIYAMLRTAKALIQPPPASLDLYSKDFNRAVASIDTRQREYYSVFDDANWRTVLTGPMRARVLNDEDPRIRVGFETCLNLLLTMDEKVERAGARFLVVLIPTKESVFWPKIRLPKNRQALENVIMRESRLNKEIAVTLESRNISFVDVLTVLRTRQQQPYFEDADGHPNEDGHQFIAEEVARFLMANPVN